MGIAPSLKKPAIDRSRLVWYYFATMSSSGNLSFFIAAAGRATSLAGAVA
ncbi:MAG: hypothetical protein R3C44_13670 [Chloroflexota bacterium]